MAAARSLLSREHANERASPRQPTMHLQTRRQGARRLGSGPDALGPNLGLTPGNARSTRARASPLTQQMAPPRWFRQGSARVSRALRLALERHAAPAQLWQPQGRVLCAAQASLPRGRWARCGGPRSPWPGRRLGLTTVVALKPLARPCPASRASDRWQRSRQCQGCRAVALAAKGARGRVAREWGTCRWGGCSPTRGSGSLV